MRKQQSHPHQLSFSIGRPLPVLIEEILQRSRNQQLRQAAKQMQEALQILEVAHQTGESKSARTNQAIHEILTK